MYCRAMQLTKRENYGEGGRSKLLGDWILLLAIAGTVMCCEQKTERRDARRIDTEELAEFDEVAERVDLAALKPCQMDSTSDEAKATRPAQGKVCIDIESCVDVLKKNENETEERKQKVEKEVAMVLARADRTDVAKIGKLLGSSSRLVRKVAALSLGMMGANARGTVDSLVEAANRGQPKALWAILKLGDSRGIPLLINRLVERHAFIGQEEQSLLSGMGVAAVAKLVDIVIQSQNGKVVESAIDILGRLGSDASSIAPSLKAAIADDRLPDKNRGAAALALGAVGQQSSENIATIKEIRKSANDSLKKDLDHALCLLGDVNAGRLLVDEYLLQMEAGKSEQARHDAFIQLIQLGPCVVLALPELTDIISSEIDYRRGLAIDALGYTASLDVVPILVSCLSSRSLVVVERAVIALGSLGRLARDSVTSIDRTRTTHWSLVVRNQAKEAIGRIRKGLAPRRWFRKGNDLARDQTTPFSWHLDHGSLNCYCDTSDVPFFKLDGTWWAINRMAYINLKPGRHSELPVDAYIPLGHNSVIRLGNGWLIGVDSESSNGLFLITANGKTRALTPGRYCDIARFGEFALAYSCPNELGFGEVQIYLIEPAPGGIWRSSLLVELPCESHTHLKSKKGTLVEISDCGAFEIQLDGKTTQLPCRPPCKAQMCKGAMNSLCCVRQ